MTPRQMVGLAALFAGVILVSTVAGIGVARLLYGNPQASPPVVTTATTAATTRPATTQPAGPTTRPALMDPAEGITLTGKALCGSCFLGIEPLSKHSVLLVTEQPYRTFHLAENDKLKEIEAITGSCAAGDIELTATGDVLIVNGENVLLVRSFSHRTFGADTDG